MLLYLKRKEILLCRIFLYHFELSLLPNAEAVARRCSTK